MEKLRLGYARVSTDDQTTALQSRRFAASEVSSRLLGCQVWCGPPAVGGMHD